MLNPLAGSDAEAVHELLQANRDHLMRWSDYSGELGISVQQWRDELGDGSDLDFGLRLDGTLVGRVRLIDHQPRYGLGYWVAQPHTGRGLAAAGVRAVIVHTRDALGGSDILAGVSLGNAASARVLRRNEFRSVAVFGTYERFHLPLNSRGLSTIAAAQL
ncbi:GNAT family N-acetyltransferase [Occultella kanbiaonis]|uniref:GNAT family N-acetyltransferase n=1 Tax=Occultella kanbiaonis TaxID=2675754 RepID=UPI00143DF7E6|nr:GNAT family N-acetyltransferase [Occultella kanbiaonis]